MVYWLLLAGHISQRTFATEASFVAADAELGHAASLHKSILDWKALSGISSRTFRQQDKATLCDTAAAIATLANSIFFFIILVELQGKG